MKINEITDKNASWANLSNIDIADIYNSYKVIKEAWPKIVSSRSPTLIQVHKQNLIKFMELLFDIEVKLVLFPEINDPDLLQIKNDITKIKQEINILIQQTD
jgi:hypothetical protein